MSKGHSNSSVFQHEYNFGKSGRSNNSMSLNNMNKSQIYTPLKNRYNMSSNSIISKKQSNEGGVYQNEILMKRQFRSLNRTIRSMQRAPKHEFTNNGK